MRALLLTLLCARAQAACPSRAAPLLDRTAETAVSRATQIRELESYAFTLTGEDEERLGIRTNGVLILSGGALVYESYARGWTGDKRHYAWSMSKSVINALTGIAVGHGLVSLSDSVCKSGVNQKHCDITIQNLLEFSSGLDWAETYEGQSNQASSVLAMLYGEGRGDMVKFIAGHPSRDPPGTTYMYSSGDTTFLSGVLDPVLRRAFGGEYEWTMLFDKLGIESAIFETDGRGVPVGSSWLFATPRDFARLGLFWLDDGCWDGQRILPEQWMRDSTAVSAPFKMRPLGIDPGDVQGRQFWLNLPVPEQNLKTPWPDVPEDAFAARGHWGQSITMIPSLDVVVVRTADDREKAFDFNRFLKLCLEVAL